MSKDRVAFMEGFAYCWQNPHQGRGPKKNLSAKFVGNDFGLTEDDTESDSSISVLPSQSSTRRGEPVSSNTNPG